MVVMASVWVSLLILTATTSSSYPLPQNPFFSFNSYPVPSVTPGPNIPAPQYKSNLPHHSDESLPDFTEVLFRTSEPVQYEPEPYQHQHAGIYHESLPDFYENEPFYKQDNTLYNKPAPFSPLMSQTFYPKDLPEFHQLEPFYNNHVDIDQEPDLIKPSSELEYNEPSFKYDEPHPIQHPPIYHNSLPDFRNPDPHYHQPATIHHPPPVPVYNQPAEFDQHSTPVKPVTFNYEPKTTWMAKHPIVYLTPTATSSPPKSTSTSPPTTSLPVYTSTQEQEVKDTDIDNIDEEENADFTIDNTAEREKSSGENKMKMIGKVVSILEDVINVMEKKKSSDNEVGDEKSDKLTLLNPTEMKTTEKTSTTTTNSLDTEDALLKMAAERLREMEDLMMDTVNGSTENSFDNQNEDLKEEFVENLAKDGLILLEPNEIGEVISVSDGSLLDGMNIVDFEQEAE